MKSKKKAAKTPELGLKGRGVEPVVISEIENAAEKYVEARDERIKLLAVEVEAKEALMSVIHRHADKLTKEVGGGLSYRYNERLVILKPTGENVKVKSVHDDGEEEEKD